MTWVDDLVPAAEDRFPVLSVVCSAPITDAGTTVHLGAIDQSCAGLIYHFLHTSPGTGLVVQLPRGQNELAVLLGCIIQLVRLAPRVTGNVDSTSFEGPVVVVGMDTLVHKRLARIRIANQPLHLALSAGRIRSDGKMVDSAGAIRDIVGDELLYLNTRVGWPRLPMGLKAGVVIIDRSTFSSSAILDLALAWATTHHTRQIIVMSEIGDERTVDQTKHLLGNKTCIWPWTDELISDCLATLGAPEDTSSLSANELVGGRRQLSVIRPSSGAIEDLSAQILQALAVAGGMRSDFPPSLRLARRLFNGLIQLWGRLETFNLHAALDHRTSALSSLRYRIESEREPHVDAHWTSYYMARWTDLRLNLMKLYELAEQDNPKFLGLALAIEWIRESDQNAPICIRVPSVSAGLALADDVADLLPEWPIDEKLITWEPWGSKLPWSVGECFELQPSSPPPSRAGSLWTAEASQQVHVLYGFELANVIRRIEQTNDLSIQRLTDACAQLGLGELPQLTASIDVAEIVEFDRDGPPAKSLADLSVDLDAMFVDADEATSPTSEDSESSETAGDPVLSVPVVLEPDGSRWYVRHNAQVEVLTASKVVYLRVDSVTPGMTVVVPKGEGREELFSRLVSATHETETLQTFEVMFTRWRQACWMAYEAAGSSWRNLEHRMREEGCRLTWQSPRTWASGAVLGPEDPEDIRRIGKIAGDPLVEGQFRRIDATVRQVRSLHIRLGSLLSAAMTEAIRGEGPSLQKLQQVLGGIDPTELLDEFELRVVRAVGNPEEIPGHLIRKVVSQ